jgi:DNA-directed RNA polymerase specialized sigma24 family protein
VSEAKPRIFIATLDRPAANLQNPPMAKLAVIPEEGTQKPPATLGDVLYAKAKGAVPEQHWETLVEAVAAGDQLALHELYEMAHRIVFTLIMRLTANRETAEELTIDVFHDVWRRAWRYDSANGTVLGWIMNQARSRAIDRLRSESRKKRNARHPARSAGVPLPPTKSGRSCRQHEFSIISFANQSLKPSDVAGTVDKNQLSAR